MSEAPHGVSARADLIGGLIWLAFGGAIVSGAYAMDRLEHFGATVYTAPGLVPGLLGLAIAILGALLLVRAIRAGGIAALASNWRPTPQGAVALRRTAVATLLALVYTLGMLGRMPFPLATFVFVFVFIMVFDVSATAPRPLPRRAVLATLTALATAAVVSLVFERVFLVRLP